MQTRFEQAIEIIRRLSPEEIEKLGELIEAMRRNDLPDAEEVSEMKGEEIRRRRMEWLKANAARYGGQYVVLDGDNLIGTAKNYAEGKRIALKAGVTNAFVDYLSKPDEEGFMGGW